MCVSHGAELYEGQADGHPPFIHIDFFKSLVEQYKALEQEGDKSLTPQFQGEPTLHPEFLELCEFLEKKNMGFSFVTNGSRMTPELSREILKMKCFSAITFSFDGATKETYESIRIGANYEKVKNNINTFLRLADERMKNGLTVSLSYTEQPMNENETMAFIRKWVNSVTLISINNVAVNGRPVKLDWQPQRVHCRDLWHNMIVLTNGQVVPCCRDYLYQLDMGSLQENTLEEIWLGEKYQWMRGIHRQGKWDSIPLCADCDTWMVGIKKWKWKMIFPNILVFQGPFFRSIATTSHFLPLLKRRSVKFLRDNFSSLVSLDNIFKNWRDNK
jgi:radical SAM protein with 4Fe4S-binding SPASM domain